MFRADQVAREGQAPATLGTATKGGICALGAAGAAASGGTDIAFTKRIATANDHRNSLAAKRAKAIENSLQ
ncbi:hypothetical protein C725_2170 [Pacificimonas flava]|uniref:Uncharacterized protein n=1 Tax=Pacificimonas flava TaxID=1234595 RepID=M2T7F1_9SPHN|nr:hypothetical protein C725_2170 [Pacificimonas flava]